MSIGGGRGGERQGSLGGRGLLRGGHRDCGCGCRGGGGGTGRGGGGGLADVAREIGGMEDSSVLVIEGTIVELG